MMFEVFLSNFCGGGALTHVQTHLSDLLDFRIVIFNSVINCNAKSGLLLRW